MINSKMIKEKLVELGLNSGDHVMVHSSLKSLGYVDGGADAVINTILDVVGVMGTILVPTNVFNGSMTLFLRGVNQIDLRTAPSLMGKITETLRLRPDSIRSIHPTHPVAAIGNKACELLCEHHLGDSPIGSKSPYGKLASMENGRILLIGVGNGNNSTIHTAEEYYTPYIFNGEVFNVRTTATNGETYNIKVKGYCVNVKRNFKILDPILLENGCMKRIKIGESEVSLINSSEMLKVARMKIRENPYILIDQE